MVAFDHEAHNLKRLKEYLRNIKEDIELAMKKLERLEELKAKRNDKE